MFSTYACFLQVTSRKYTNCEYTDFLIKNKTPGTNTWFGNICIYSITCSSVITTLECLFSRLCQGASKALQGL